MKIKNIIKKQTTVIAIAVILITITVIGVSYSVFFDVKKNSQNQVITAGDLEMTLNAESLNITEAISTADGLALAGINYTPKNTGNLNATYSLYIYASDANTVDLKYVKYSLDGKTSAVITSITDTITENGKTYYKVDSGTLEANASGSAKNIKVWIDSEIAPDTINGKNIDLSFYIVSEVQE